MLQTTDTLTALSGAFLVFVVLARLGSTRGLPAARLPAGAAAWLVLALWWAATRDDLRPALGLVAIAGLHVMGYVRSGRSADAD